MEEKEQMDEKNVEALLRAGYPAQGRLDPRLRAAMYGRLAQTLRARPAFPPLALGLLCAALFLLAACLMGAANGIFSFSEGDLLVYLAAGVLLLNLLCLPIASILIVIRRKHA